MSGIHFNPPVGPIPHHAKTHAKKPPVEETLNQHKEFKTNHLEKPTPHNKEILHHPPTLYYFEINTSQDLDKFKLTLITPSIRPAVNASVLWKELKPKMIEELTKHLK